MTTVKEWTGRLVQALVTVPSTGVSNGRQLPRLSTCPSLPNDRDPSRDQRLNEMSVCVQSLVDWTHSVGFIFPTFVERVEMEWSGS